MSLSLFRFPTILSGEGKKLATLSATVSGDKSLISAKLTALSNDDGGSSAGSAIAVAEKDGIKVTTSGDTAASGDETVVSLILDSFIKDDTAGGLAFAAAEGELTDDDEEEEDAGEAEEPQEGNATATADTDAEVTGPVVITSDEDGKSTETEPNAARETSFSFVSASLNNEVVQHGFYGDIPVISIRDLLVETDLLL
jgi:hypothetical protein